MAWPPTPFAQSSERCFTSFHPKNVAALLKYDEKFFQYSSRIYSILKSLVLLLMLLAFKISLKK